MNTFTAHDAYRIAMRALSNKIDYAGDSIFEHSMRVALALDGDKLRIVGALHDIIEDSYITEAQLLRLGVPPFLATQVTVLTRLSSETYRQYIDRVALHKVATTVKLADLSDHLAPGRFRQIPVSLVKRYEKAITRLYAHEEPDYGQWR